MLILKFLSIKKPSKDGDKADENTVNGRANDLISPNHLVPYLSAIKELNTGGVIPLANPKNKKNKIIENWLFRLNKKQQENIIGNWDREVTLCAENLSIKIPENRDPKVADIAYHI